MCSMRTMWSDGRIVTYSRRPGMREKGQRKPIQLATRTLQYMAMRVSRHLEEMKQMLGIPERLGKFRIWAMLES